MNPAIALSTYDMHGTVLQLSDTLVLGFEKSEIIGSSVYDWGNAAQHLATTMFSRDETQTHDITWSFSGIAGVTRCSLMKLDPSSVVVVAAHRYRTWILTETELSVIQCIADGCTITEAAEQLLLSVDAVKSALVRVRSKTGARGTAHAVAICCRAGVI